jgi:hypothetical protein
MKLPYSQKDRVPQVSLLRPGKTQIWSRFAGPAVILLAAAVAITPQLVRGTSCGHDFDFHLVSWLDCLNSWQHGILYPHWAASANFGAGEPRFIFYPPLTWMLGAALGSVLPWQFVPVALTFLLLAATGLATRLLAREALPDGAATLAGCTALFSGYALFTAYERTAFGELTGGFWIPLLLLFALHDQGPSRSWASRVFDGSAAPLALVVAGCWLSNLPVGVMGCYLLAAVAVAAALLTRSWAPMLRAGIAAVVGIALAGLYLVPAVWEQSWVDIRQATSDPGLLIENSLLFASHANPALADHDIELHKVSIITLSMIALALAGLLVCWIRTRLVPKDQSRPLHWWIPLALIPLAILFLQLPISLPVWNLLPRLRFLQFPWRWLVALEAPMAIFFATAVWPRDSARRWWRVAVAVVCAGFFLSATVFTAHSFFQVCYDEDAVSGMLTTLRSGVGVEGYDEFAPPDADNSLVATSLPDACLASNPTTVLGASSNDPEADETVLVWNVGQGSCEEVLRWQSDQPEHKRLVTAIGYTGMPNQLAAKYLGALVPHPRFLILRLRSYPAWRIAVNGYPVAVLPHRDDGLIVVPVWPGTIALTVDWTTTPDALAGRWLSVLAVLALTGLWLFERKLGQPRLS